MRQASKETSSEADKKGCMDVAKAAEVGPCRLPSSKSNFNSIARAAHRGSRDKSTGKSSLGCGQIPARGANSIEELRSDFRALLAQLHP